MGATHESIVASFGSRISMNFRPGTREIYLSPIGRFLDKPVSINFGVVYDGRKYGLNFFDEKKVWGFGNDQTEFEFIEQHEEFDRVIFRCRDYSIGVDCVFEFIAPFYPQDKEFCTMPALFVKATVNRLIDRAVRADDEKEIQIYCDLMGSDFKEEQGGMYQSDRYFLYDDYIHYQDTTYLKDFLKGLPYVKDGIQGDMFITCASENRVDGKTILADGTISQTKAAESCFVIAGYTSDTVLCAKEEEYQFYYTHRYQNVFEVAAQAKKEYREILEQSESFGKQLKDSTLSEDYLNFLGFAFRSYAANVWWGIDKSSQKEWFSVWEGNCLFHSTIDVEYNLGVFYLMLWPELLEKQLLHWNEYKKEGHISHDIGAILNADCSAYPHDMEIEENCNFILLLYAFYKTRGQEDMIRNLYPTVKELILFNKSCDLTGNGMPNKGTANTIDDSSDDVQFAQEQIYIGLKEYAAYLAAEKIAQLMKDEEIQRLCEEESKKIQNTIEEKGWLGDHYGVNLVSTNGTINAYSLYQSVGAISSEQGMNAYSTYTANGFLYLFLSGEDIVWNCDRLKEDIVKAEEACRTPFGCTHSSVDKSNIWISQNIFRDLCAGYLGVDMSDNIQKYWAYELYENQGARGGCFIDTYGWNRLNYYPRGLTAIGYLYSMLGMQIDEQEKKIKLQPSKVPVSLPLFHFANWAENKVPKVRFYLQGRQMKYEIEHEEMLCGYTITV